MHRRLYMYDAAGHRIIEQELPFNPNDPGTHSCKAFKKNNEWKTVFHDKKGSRQQIGSSFFKPICRTNDNSQGLMKQVKHSLNDTAHVQQKFEQLSGVTSRLSSESYHLGNVIEEKATSHLKTTQYMLNAGTDLFDYLQKRKRIELPLSTEEKLNLACQCLKALAVLHAKNIVHGDIKPENICRNKNGFISIIDFDASFRSDVQTDTKSSGTLGYMPPEYFRAKAIPDNFGEYCFDEDEETRIKIYSLLEPNYQTFASKTSDVFSMGLVLCELQITESCYEHLIDNMLRENPLARPDIAPWAEMSTDQIHRTISMQYQPAQRYTPPPPPTRQKPNHQEIDPNRFFHTADASREDGITLDRLERMASSIVSPG